MDKHVFVRIRIRFTTLKYLSLGLAIRFVLMPIAALPHDAIGNFFIAYVAEHYGIYNFFLHYFSTNPPFLIYILAFFFRIYEFFAPGFFFERHIIPSLSGYPILFETFPNENYPYYEKLMHDPGIYALLFFGKIPMLIFDIAIAFILLRIFNDIRKSTLAFKIWMFNPISLYTIFIFGELEVVSIFFAVLGTYLIYKKKWGSGIFWLGVSIALKPIALMLLPFALVSMKNSSSVKQISKFLMISLIPFVIQSTFLLASIFFQGVQMVTQVDIHKMYPIALSIWVRTLVEYSLHAPTFAQFIDVIYIFPLTYAILLMVTIFSSKINHTHIWAINTIVFSLLFALNLFHPHWFLWFAPFFIVFAIQNDKKLPYIFYLISLLFVIYCFYWASLQLALFMPISPTIYQLPGALSSLESAGLPGIYLVNLARSIFSGILLFLSVFSIKIIYLGDTF